MRTRVSIAALALFIVAALILMTSGYFVFNRARQDPLAKADAIVVLGGEHDGREAYALALARQGFASTILMSNPYGPDDAIMADYCDAQYMGIELICRAPVPSTTRGEAAMARGEAQERGWTRIIVITWQFHLPRARYVFANCYSRGANSVIFRAVPREYDYSPLRWGYTYLYQYAGFAKAAVQGECGGRET